MPTRALGYARVSSLEQAQGTSLQDQQNAIAAHAKARGLKVAHFYVEAESAIHEKIERREQMRALLADARAGDLVVCDKLDRWSRDTEWTLRSVRELREKGAAFYAVTDACDPSTPDGEMMLTMRAMMAKEEHRRIRLRTVGTRQLLRDQGYYVEGLPPIGYRRAHPVGYRGVDKNVLVIVTKEADLVRRVFRLAIAGRSISQIMAVTDLNCDRVKDILSRRLYVGEIQNSRGEWIAGKHPALIDAGTYARARQSVDGRSLGGPRPRGAPARTDGWILRDVATCARCGARMGASYGSTKVYYRCSHACTSAYVQVLAVEEQAAAMVAARLVELRDGLSARAAPAPIIDHTSKLEKLAQRRERLLDGLESGSVTVADLRGRLERLDAERARLLADAPRVIDPRMRREMLREVKALTHAWANASGPERRQTVNLLVSRADLAAHQRPALVWRGADDLTAEE